METQWQALEQDPELLRVALAMIDDLDSDGSGSSAPDTGAITSSHASPSPDVCANADLDRGGPSSQPWMPWLGSNWAVRKKEDGQHRDASAEASVARGASMPTTRSLRSTAADKDEQAAVTPEEMTANGSSTKQVNSTILRRKQERRVLQDILQKLEKELATLQQDRRAQEVERQQHSQVAGMWKKLATNQQERRRRAEIENAKLRSKLRAQIRRGKALMEMFQRSSCAQHEESEETELPRPLPSSLDFEREALGRIQEMHRQRVSIFDDELFGITSRPNFCDVRTTDRLSHRHTRIDVRSGWMLPFSVERVLVAEWGTVLRGKQCALANLDLVGATTDTIVASYACDSASRAESPLLKANVHGTVVVKRFYDPDLDEGIVIFISQGDVIEQGAEVAGTTVAMEHVTRIQRMHHPATGETMAHAPVASRIQSWRRTHFQFAPDTEPSKWLKSALACILEDATAEVHWKQEVIENLLLSPQSDMLINTPQV